MDLIDLVLRILLSALLGGLIGLERELRDRAAGFRTHILVAVGAAAFTVASVHGFDSFLSETAATNVRIDPGRIAAQVVSGIGFLGAGAIIRHGVSVRGLTTAASLWAAAAVGLASGIGMYDLAAVTAVTVVASLYGLRFVEGRFIYPRVRDLVDLRVTFRRRGFGPLTHLVDTLDHHHMAVQHMSVEAGGTDTNSIRLILELPRGATPASVAQLVAELDDIESVTLG
ncbi:MAG: MgtC/SapB family protein [Thermoleophilia bacterium]